MTQPVPSSSTQLCLREWHDESSEERHVCKRHEQGHRGWHVCMCNATLSEPNLSIEDEEPSTLSKVFGDDGQDF